MIVLYTTEREYPWGTLRSTNASKTKVILEEKGLAYQVERLRPGDLWKKPPEMLVKHPLGKVPFIDDGELTVFDSTVINEYLEERYPDPSLMPSDPVARARVRAFENFGDEAVLVGDLPAIWMPYWQPEDNRDADAMEKGREGLRRRALPYMEQALKGEGFICGDFTLADAPYMAMAMVLEVDGMDLGDFSEAAAYLDRLRSRPSYASISPRTSLEDSGGRGDG